MQPPASESIAYFYEDEGPVSPDFYPQYLKSLQSSQALLNKFRLRLGPPWLIWNSGVVAFTANDIKAGILDDTLLE